MNLGLKYPVYAIYSDVTGTPTYKNGGVMAKAISANISWTKNNAELYADDGLEASDYSIQYGTETIEIHQLSSKVQAALLGHNIVDGAVIASENDEAPFIGHGFYGKSVIDRNTKWCTIWIYKMKYNVPDTEMTTKGETTEFKTPSLEGKISKDICGNFVEKKFHDTEAEAIAYLNGKAGIVPQLNKPEASIESGTYAGAQTVELLAQAGATIYFTTNGTTPSETNGTEYTAPIEISSSCALRAIAVKDSMSNSEIASYEYIITV